MKTLTSHFSVSTVASTESVSSTKGEKTEAQARLHSGPTNHSHPSGPLASLSAIKRERRKGILMNSEDFKFAEHVKTAQIKMVNLPPRGKVSTALPKPVGLPPNPKAFLTAQRNRELNPRNNKAQAAKLNNGWQTAQEILGTKE
jgi:hypothetical protein